MICHVDDCCILSKDKETTKELSKNPSKTFKMPDEGDINSYLGMNVRNIQMEPSLCANPQLSTKY